jgi:hypothetical protein
MTPLLTRYVNSRQWLIVVQKELEKAGQRKRKWNDSQGSMYKEANPCTEYVVAALDAVQVL